MIDRVVCLGVDKRSREFWPSLRDDCKKCTGLDLDIFVAGSQNDPELVYNHVDLPYDPMMRRYVGYSPNNEQAIATNFNIFLCHKKILANAIERYENILLMEDDAKFIVNRWQQVWNSPQVRDFFAGSDWDALFLGYWQRLYEGDKVYGEAGERNWKQSKIINIRRAQPDVPGRISGLHGCLLNKKFIPTLYKGCKRSPLDSFINNRLDMFNIYYLEPQLITVRSNYSFCEQVFIEREELT